LTAFGVIFFILGQKSKDLGKVMAIWIIPCVSMIASGTCGGLLAGTLAPEFPRLALITTTFAITMGIVGLSFTIMITFGFLMRLLLHGTPDGMIALATFNILTPLGQGGFCLLINGANLSKLVPYAAGDDFPEIALAGKLLFSICFCSAYVLWCMGIAWILLSLFVIFRRVRRLPRFGIAWWGLVFPNGTWALLSVQLGNVLESRFYHGIGAVWSIVVFTTWTLLMLRSIPAFVTGTMFLPPAYYLEGRAAKKQRRHHHDKNANVEKTSQPAETRQGSHSPECGDHETLVNADGVRVTARPPIGAGHAPSVLSESSQRKTPNQSGWTTPVEESASAHDIPTLPA
jgi:tellurite resistance protein TehA-like permease